MHRGETDTRRGPDNCRVRFGLLAADEVGLAAALTMASHGVRPLLLCLDSRDRQGVNRAIQDAAGVPDVHILTSETWTAPRSLQLMQDMQLDIGIAAWWPYIVPSAVLEHFRLGALNIHPSLLPHGRGKDPNFWCLVEGAPFGATLHWITSEIDAGPIAFQSDAITPTWLDTGGSLYERALESATALFERSFAEIKAGRIPRVDQGTGRPARRRAELESASQVHLARNYTGRELLNLLRARTFPPHPGAWFEAEGHRYEVRIEISKSDKDSA